MAMPFNTMLLLPLAAKLGELVKEAIDRYAALRAFGGTVDEDVLAAFLTDRMRGWNPIVSGRAILADEGTRDAFARAVAGIAFALVK